MIAMPRGEGHFGQPRWSRVPPIARKDVGHPEICFMRNSCTTDLTWTALEKDIVLTARHSSLIVWPALYADNISEICLDESLSLAETFDTAGANLNHDERSKTRRKYDLGKEIPIWGSRFPNELSALNKSGNSATLLHQTHFLETHFFLSEWLNPTYLLRGKEREITTRTNRISMTRNAA